MRNDTLVKRMNEFVERQTACCEELARDLESLTADTDLETLDRVADLQQTHQARTETLAREFERLQAEWDAADLSEAERAEVRTGAHRAGQATERLAALNLKWKNWVDKQRIVLGGELAGLQRGREAAHKYGVDRDTNASFIDQKA